MAIFVTVACSLPAEQGRKVFVRQLFIGLEIHRNPLKNKKQGLTWLEDESVGQTDVSGVANGLNAIGLTNERAQGERDGGADVVEVAKGKLVIWRRHVNSLWNMWGVGCGCVFVVSSLQVYSQGGRTRQKL